MMGFSELFQAAVIRERPARSPRDARRGGPPRRSIIVQAQRAGQQIPVRQARAAKVLEQFLKLRSRPFACSC
jgi:hypothetical protein